MPASIDNLLHEASLGWVRLSLLEDRHGDLLLCAVILDVSCELGSELVCKYPSLGTTLIDMLLLVLVLE